MSRRLEVAPSAGLRRMTQQLKAINVKAQLFPPGEVVAERFQLGEMIGEGPFGQVFKAEDLLIEAEVALKVFHAEVLRSPIEQERFLNATRAARTLTQKNLVRLHDSGVHKDHPWVSMQHLEGLSLRKVLNMRRAKKEFFGLDEVEPIISQITLALQHVSREHPHGNLKPENIIFLPEMLKITDSFILSALAPEVFSKRLAKSTYLAPELHTPDDNADTACDVYSMGMIIGEMLFGADYTPGNQPNMGPEHTAVDALCRRATAFDPSERYANMEALSEDFATLVDTGRLLEEHVTGKLPVIPPPAPPAAPPAPPAAPRSAPPAAPASPKDLLLTETPHDIGVPLDEDLATTEVKRGGVDLGELIETNEVRRGQLPRVPEKKPAAKDSAQPPKETTKTVMEPTPAAPREAAKSPPVAIFVIIGVVLLIAFVAFLNKKGSDPGGPVSIGGDPNIVASEGETKGDDDKAALAEKAAQEAAAKQAENVKVVLARASDTRVRALTAAGASAKTAGEALAAEAARKKEEEEAAKAAAAAADTTTTTTTTASSGTGSGSKPDGAAAATTTTTAPVASGTQCPDAMNLVKARSGNYCIDTYEYPGRGRTPKVHVSWFDARRECANQNKRLCKLSEWRGACGSQYPYGNKFDPDRCNTADEDGFERSLAAAGSKSRCRSRSGAYDMSGNVHEWVEEQRVAGGGFDSDEDLASCRYSSPKAPGSGAGNIGFRCCAPAE